MRRAAPPTILASETRRPRRRSLVDRLLVATVYGVLFVGVWLLLLTWVLLIFWGIRAVLD